jgi:protein gp37
MDHIFFGLTISNQQEADEKIPIFLKLPGKKFLNINPMLEPILLGGFDGKIYRPWMDHIAQPKMIDAVILGGETGPGARPLNPDWVRSVRDKCDVAGVDFFFSGWGTPVPVAQEWSVLKKGRELDKRTHDGLPWA